MSVLVTGGAGYIGGQMVLALRDAGESVVVLDDLSTGFASAIPRGVDFVQGCVGDEDLVARIIARYKIDEVVHFAGSIIVPESVSDPLKYYLNNTVRSRSLIDSAVRGGVKRFVFSSSAAVYGESSEQPLDETSRLEPVSPYGASKLMTERMLSDVAKAHDFNFVALRYFNVAGADPAGRAGQSGVQATHLIKIACQAAVGLRGSLNIYGEDYPTPDGTCIRDYVHVSDLAHAHIQALGYLRREGQNLIANCGYGRGFSVREVIDAVKRVSGYDFQVEPAPRRQGDPAVLVASPQLLSRKLNWRPKFDDLDLIVRHALDWETALVEQRANSGRVRSLSIPVS